MLAIFPRNNNKNKKVELFLLKFGYTVIYFNFYFMLLLTSDLKKSYRYSVAKKVLPLQKKYKNEKEVEKAMRDRIVICDYDISKIAKAL
jgi:hypothetical protein